MNGRRGLVATLVAAALATALVSCNSQSRSEPSTSGPECRRNYLTADDLDPSEMFKTPLPIPNRLTPNYTDPDDPSGTPVWVVHARAYTWRPADGVCIDKWGYEGTTPGPTLVAAPGEPSQLVVYNELPDNLYNPYFDPFNQLAWQAVPAPNRTHYTSFGASPIEPPAPFDEPPYAQTQYELSPDLSIHLHGGHQTPENDGHPMDTFEPGHSRVYDYPNNQEATTLWYHDHAMDHTRGHVLNGLAGFYLVADPAADAALGLPTGKDCMSESSFTTPSSTPPYWPTPDPLPADPQKPTACDDIPIMFQQVPAEMLSGTQFQPTGIGSTGTGKEEKPNPQYEAVWTVNGTLSPYLTVTNKPYRFRFLNGNDEEPMQIWTSTSDSDPTSYPADAYLQQVGTDGGLMNSVAVADPPSQTTISLYPAQRADVVLDFSKITTKTTIYLQSRSLQAFVGGTHPSCLTSPCDNGDNVDQTPKPLIKFVVDPTTTAPVPFDPPGGVLRSGADAITKVSQTTTDGAPVKTRSLLFGFTANLGKNPFATINGQFYNPEQTASQPVLGSTETWQLINNTDGYHPVHIHDIEFQVISRSRCPSPNRQADKPSKPSDPLSWCKEKLEAWTELPAQAGDWASCPDGATSCNLAWTDVFVVPPYSQVTVIGTFTDNIGTYVFHCHNLIHEDAGMMAQFEVVGDNTSPPTHSMVTHS